MAAWGVAVLILVKAPGMRRDARIGQVDRETALRIVLESINGSNVQLQERRASSNLATHAVLLIQ